MKKLLIFVFATVFSTSLFADTLKVDINGMVCAFCANGVEKKFKKMKSVKKIDVNLENKVVTIEFAGEIPLSDLEITKLITGAGYQVAGIKRVVK